MFRPALQQVGAFSRLLCKASPLVEGAGFKGLSAGLSTSSTASTANQNSRYMRMGMGLIAGAAAVAAMPIAAAAPSTSIADPPASKDNEQAGAPSKSETRPKLQQQVIFVLGGPGSGKGTQCARLLEEYLDLAHLSAGDLLRAFVKSGTPEGNEVAEMIRNGQIVPSEVTVGLLRSAMEASGKPRVLIDGFPRNLENRDAFERVMGFDCVMVLFFDCPEEVMQRRLLSRNQGRVDDNLETIKKRFKVYEQQSMPVIEYYEKLGKVARINADRAPEVVFEEVKRLFA